MSCRRLVSSAIAATIATAKAIHAPRLNVK